MPDDPAMPQRLSLEPDRFRLKRFKPYPSRGLDPRDHVLTRAKAEDVDGRVKPGHGVVLFETIVR
jgi:hypothetical protein